MSGTTGTTPGAPVIDVLAAGRVVPVVSIDDADDAVALVAALVAGGLTAVEITLRTPAGLAAIRRASAEVSAAVVGAGSVMSAAATRSVVDAGARFVLSPGLDEGVVATARERGVPVIPGIATPTELMRAVDLGVEIVKVFPAEQLGGPRFIEALSAVWPDVRFVPTGGVSLDDLGRYLAVPQVLAVGGSWMAPRAAVAGRDWASITRAAADAVRVAGEAP